MDSNNFLTELLGTDITFALQKATSSKDSLKGFLVPRLVWGLLEKFTQYEGTFPGLAKSSFEFVKTGDRVSGFLKSPSTNLQWKEDSIAFVTASIVESLGLNTFQKSELRQSDLDSLSKVVDKVLTSLNLSKTIDYSHLLSPVLKSKGFKISVQHTNNTMCGLILHKNEEVGSFIANVLPNNVLYIQNVDLLDEYRKRGLGFSLYEASLKYANDVLKIQKIEGDTHSTDAHKVHEKLCKKYGWDLGSETVKQQEIQTAYDNRFLPYKIDISRINKKQITIKKSEIDTRCGLCNKPTFVDSKLSACICCEELYQDFSFEYKKDEILVKSNSSNSDWKELLGHLKSR
jgi:hypothetical protein